MDIDDLNIGDRIKLQDDPAARGGASILDSAASFGYGHLLGIGTIIDMLTEEEAIEQGHVSKGCGGCAIVDWSNGDLTDAMWTLPENERGMVINFHYIVKVESDA